MADVSDAGLKRAVETLETAMTVEFLPERFVRRADGSVRRGSPALVERGRTRVRLPGESAFRGLEPFELEALVQMAQAGDLKLALPWIPGIGQAGPPRPAAIGFEDGRVLEPGMDGYPPKAAIWGV